MKVFRYLIFYFRMDKKQLKERILFPCFEYFKDTTSIIIVLLMTFAAIGLTYFGGYINSYTLEIFNQESDKEFELSHLNFNTYANSIIYFFAVALNDSWSTIANLSVVENGVNFKYLRFLFVIFKFYMNYIILFSIIGFIIQVFNEYEKGVHVFQKFLDDNEKESLFEDSNFSDK